MKLRLIICLLLIATPSAVLAAEYLTVVTSEVYRASGTQKEIATRASTCISQYLAAGTTDSQLIVSSDLDGGVIVARSALIFSDKLIQWKFRSTFTFEAREGRFRIEQTNLERFNDLGGGWGGIGKWWGSNWKKAEQAFQTSATVVAQCVIAGPKKQDW